MMRCRDGEGVRRKSTFSVNSLPLTVRVYINNQVLIPASLVRALGLENAKYANIVIEYKGVEIELRGVKLLRTRHTYSRQFTIPREIRELFRIEPLDEITILRIEPTIEEYPGQINVSVLRMSGHNGNDY